MDEMVRTDQLKNGLLVEFRDFSNRYYGDYHRVRVEVRCRCLLAEGYFAGSDDPQGDLRKVKEQLGAELSFVRNLEKMGVAGDAVAATRQGLIESFIQSTFPYLESPNFPVRLIARELAQVQKKVGSRQLLQ